MRALIITLVLPVLAACASKGPVLDTTNPSFEGDMPVNFSGSWERDYARSQDVNGALNAMFQQRQREVMQQQQANSMSRVGPVQSGLSQREVNAMIDLARLIEEITRPEVLTISQDAYEVRIARKDDFAMSCAFYDGVAQGTDSQYGAEVCSWEGDDLVSHLVLPGGLIISRRYTLSPDGNQLREITTAKSSATRSPLVLHRYYFKFEAPARAFNCVETLSMKRVCSTGELNP
ncbi:MAG: hypothetical protein GTN98_15260 [Woeseiaceae bacterium]|nr:hypothetical protein [Woeseiaceae bacterium]